MKTIIRRHTDILTVTEEIMKMEHEYLSQGYEAVVVGNVLRIRLEDGIVVIYWQDGAFWQEIIADADADGRANGSALGAAAPHAIFY